MKNYIALQSKLKTAWAKLPADIKAQLEPHIRAAHEHAVAVRDAADLRKNPSLRQQGVISVPKCPVPHQFMMVHSLLNDDPNGLLRDACDPTDIFTSVGADGEVYFGGVDYDATDPGWAYTIVAWAATKLEQPAFNNNPATITIPNAATIAIMGDWGGNNTPAQQVATAAQAQEPDYFIHLGDVYYAGTNASLLLSPYETGNFLDPWPGQPGSSFALNSNHDMYAHATGYFNTTLASQMFAAQNQCSYFALVNDYFRIVGLDSAYYCPDDGLYMEGSLGNNNNQQQIQFLTNQASAAATAGQTLIILTHHNGLAIDGSPLDPNQYPLWTQVGDALASLPNGANVLWYWGHVHVGAAYAPQTYNNQASISPRCCGHGCIPGGVATDLQSANVIWSESEVLGPGSNYFVTNGFATLALSQGTVTETFYDQNGNSQWTSTLSTGQQATAAARH